MCFLAALNAAGENGSSRVATTRDGNLAHEGWKFDEYASQVPQSAAERAARRQPVRAAA
jgi:hypothetical protein